jgi:hypothetical protein
MSIETRAKHSDYAKKAKLQVFNYEPPTINTNLSLLKDRVVSGGEITQSTIVCKCKPILSYCRKTEENSKNILLALNTLSTEVISNLDTRVSNLYPRTPEDTLKGFKTTYYRNTQVDDSILQLLPLQPEHMIIIRCHYNEYTDGNRRFLYVEGSKFNHSCKSNCNWSVRNGTLVITTNRNIEPREELTVSYVPGFEKEPGRVRRNVLIRHMGFYCQCSECKDRCNTCNKYLDVSLKCSKCNVVKYCSKECQIIDWKENCLNDRDLNHKDLCIHL